MASVQNKPNLRGRIVRNEPNFACRRRVPEAECAKRSQTWMDWGVWAKAIVVWGVARPRSETCKTNPIYPRTGAVDGGIAQNEPNLARAWARPGERRKTNPISATGGRCRAGLPRSGTACRGNPPVRSGASSAKRQSAQNEPNLARPEGKCAKRTQFRAVAQEVGRGRPTHEECETNPIWRRRRCRPGRGQAGGPLRVSLLIRWMWPRPRALTSQPSSK
jgi:hypothetical protein